MPELRMTVHEWWARIEVWDHVLVHDGRDYLMLFWLASAGRAR